MGERDKAGLGRPYTRVMQRRLGKVLFRPFDKPANAVGDPVLVIFSDGSDNAYDACAYVRWALAGVGFDSNLVVSKEILRIQHVCCHTD